MTMVYTNLCYTCNEVCYKGTTIHHTYRYEPRHEVFNNVTCTTSKGSDQPGHTHSLIRAFAICLNIL